MNCFLLIALLALIVVSQALELSLNDTLSGVPTTKPTRKPSALPTGTHKPTTRPTRYPTEGPTLHPTQAPGVYAYNLKYSYGSCSGYMIGAWYYKIDACEKEPGRDWFKYSLEDNSVFVTYYTEDSCTDDYDKYLVDTVTCGGTTSNINGYTGYRVNYYPTSETCNGGQSSDWYYSTLTVSCAYTYPSYDASCSNGNYVVHQYTSYQCTGSYSTIDSGSSTQNCGTATTAGGVSAFPSTVCAYVNPPTFQPSFRPSPDRGPSAKPTTAKPTSA